MVNPLYMMSKMGILYTRWLKGGPLMYQMTKGDPFVPDNQRVDSLHNINTICRWHFYYFSYFTFSDHSFPPPRKVRNHFLTRYTVKNGISNLYILLKSALKMQEMPFQRPKFQKHFRGAMPRTPLQLCHHYGLPLTKILATLPHGPNSNLYRCHRENYRRKGNYRRKVGYKATHAWQPIVLYSP